MLPPGNASLPQKVLWPDITSCQNVQDFLQTHNKSMHLLTGQHHSRTVAATSLMPAVALANPGPEICASISVSYLNSARTATTWWSTTTGKCPARYFLFFCSHGPRNVTRLNERSAKSPERQTERTLSVVIKSCERKSSTDKAAGTTASNFVVLTQSHLYM